MAENGSNQSLSQPEDSSHNPVQEGTSAQVVNVVWEDELQDTIADLMKKAWKNLPRVSGSGVPRPLAQGKNILLPFRDDSPLMSGKGALNHCSHYSPGALRHCLRSRQGSWPL